jgi:peptidoglycan-associated lipoprotein
MTTRMTLAVLLLALGGCGLPANVVVLVPDANGTVGTVAVHKGSTTAELDKPLAAVDTGSEASLRDVFTAKSNAVDNAFAGALAATPRAPSVYVLYFASGSTELDPRSRGDLAAAIARAKSLSNIDIGVVGHADATGSDAYNTTLSLTRARTIRDALVAAGIRSDVIDTAYHGANNPLVSTPRGVPERRNRRVEITIR